VDLELVDANGREIAKTRTDYDGFFLFERVAYGSYTIRVAEDSAAAAKIDADLAIHFLVTPDKSIVRLGTIRPASKAHLADLGQAGSNTSFR
ncbi:MAG: hypothetical protein ACJ8F4_03310, partial [Sphingomonas sp.]